MIERDVIRRKAEELFRIEYEKALKMLQKKKPQMHPRKRIEAARKIARRKYLNFLESHSLCPADFVEHKECSLGDLV